MRFDHTRVPSWPGGAADVAREHRHLPGAIPQERFDEIERVRFGHSPRVQNFPADAIAEGAFTLDNHHVRAGASHHKGESRPR